MLIMHNYLSLNLMSEAIHESTQGSIPKGKAFTAFTAPALSGSTG